MDDLAEFMNFLEDNNFDGLTIIKLKQGYFDLPIFKNKYQSTIAMQK